MAHTPGPWKWSDGTLEQDTPGNNGNVILGFYSSDGCTEIKNPDDSRLIAAAPDMLEALQNVQKLISEAAMTGFNCKDGDWAERLFFSQQMTSKSIAKATDSQS